MSDVPPGVRGVPPPDYTGRGVSPLQSEQQPPSRPPSTPPPADAGDACGQSQQPPNELQQPPDEFQQPLGESRQSPDKFQQAPDEPLPPINESNQPLHEFQQSLKEPTSKPASQPWPAVSGNNHWNKNIKIKTCKCKTCGQRVRKYSWQCSKCLKHICSECAEVTGISEPAQKLRAEVELGKKCGCAYSSGQAPEIAKRLKELGIVERPPHTDEQDAKAKEVKRLARVTRDAAKAAAAAAAASASSNTFGDTPTSTFEIRSKRKLPCTLNYVEPTTPSDSRQDSVEPPRKKLKLKLKSTFVQHCDLSDPFLEKMKIPHAGLKRNAIAHLQDGHTVIVGAGVIGLFIARELGLKIKETGTKHSVTVVEARETFCELASGHCAGFLTSRGLPEHFRELQNLAVTAWSELSRTDDFTQAVDVSRDSLLLGIGAGGLNQDSAPSWAKGRAEMSFVNDDEAVGRLDPEKLSAWLYSQCMGVGVTFRFKQCVVKKRFDTTHDITTVDIERVGQKTADFETVECTNLVLAAGPFTPGAFKDLFKSGSRNLDNEVKACDWLHHRLSAARENDHAGLILRDAGAGNERLEDHVHCVARDIDSKPTLSISGVRARGISAVYGLYEAVNSDETYRSHQNLRATVAPYLSIEGLDLTDAGYYDHVHRTGRSLISTAKNGGPIISKVPFSGLGSVYNTGDDKRLCGVWLCYGFGNYGTFLAPGAARLLAAKMCATQAAQDVYDLEGQ